MPVLNHIFMANPTQTKRGLVLQGGVVLGAYEAGVISKLCSELYDKTEDREEHL
jgi:predicted patatin/cPLA2 family phospholipase